MDKNTSPHLVSQIGAVDTYTNLPKSTIYIYPNPDLRWEKTRSYNVGLDVVSWDGRLNATFDFYKKMGTDIVMQKQISGVNGMGLFKINGSDMNNTGVEVDLTGYPVKTENIDFSIGITYGYNKNKLIKANDGKEITLADRIAGRALVVGETVGTLYSYRFAGLDPQYGLPLFYDMYGNKEFTYHDGTQERVSPNYTVYEQEAAIVKSGTLEPHSAGGLQLAVRYKNLRLKANFEYKFGGVNRLPDIYNEEYDRVFDPFLNVSKELDKRWKKPGDEKHTNIPALIDYDTYSKLPRRALDASLTQRDGVRLYDYSDVRVASTDNIRLKSLTLNYILPNRIRNYFGVSNMVVGFQASNLFLIADKAWRGFDPDMGKSANVSIPKTYSMNVNISF